VGTLVVEERKMKRAHCVASLAILAILPLVSTSLQAQSQATNTAPEASIPKPILTADQQKKLAALMAKYGKDAWLDSAVTAALGISQGDEALIPRQLTSSLPPLLHAYIPLPDGDILLGLQVNGTAWNYRLDANLKLVAAVSKISGQAPTIIPMSDAERNVHTELAFWAAVADRH
jgi:hypothetical protein